MRTILLVVFAAAILAFSGRSTLACSCSADPNRPAVDYGNWARNFKGAAFSGRVLDIEKNASVPELKVTFAVDKYWRGVEADRVVIYTVESTAMCGVYYEVGKDYVVIADSSGGRAMTFSCSEMEYALHRAEYLAALGEGRRSGPPAQTAVKLYEFGNINCEDELLRLDGLALEIQNDPKSMAYVIIYGGSKGKRNEAKARLARMRYYWASTRGMDPARFVPIDGGYRETLSGEIWIVRDGDAPPKATPTVDAKKVRLKGTAKVRGYNCGDEMGRF